MKALQELVTEFEIFKSIPIPTETDPDGEEGDLEFSGVGADEVGLSDDESENPFGNEEEEEETEECPEDCPCACHRHDEEEEEESPDSDEELDFSELDEPLHDEDDLKKDDEFEFFS